MVSIVETARPQKNNVWYTPAKYVDAAREVMGGIDLDPASCRAANEIIRATRYFTEDDDGPSQAWSGRVYMNPPYTRTPEMRARYQSTIERFVTKLLSEYRNGNVTQAIALVTVDVNSRWFQCFWDFPICFTNHKIHFICNVKRRSYTHMFGTAFAYLGPNEDRFISTFSQFVTVARRVTPTA
jgi:hypothetical protein